MLSKGIIIRLLVIMDWLLVIRAVAIYNAIIRMLMFWKKERISNSFRKKSRFINVYIFLLACRRVLNSLRTNPLVTHKKQFSKTKQPIYR